MQRSRWQASLRSSGMGGKYGSATPLPYTSFEFRKKNLVCRYRTTVDRLLGMKLVPSRRLIRRNVSYEFMNRQMVWHAFTVRLILVVTCRAG